MAFRDYSTNPASNTTLGDGTYIGANMLRNKVRPAFQQLAADGKALWNEMNALVLDPATANFVPSGTGAVGRTIGAVLRDRPSLKDFFAVPDANYNNAFTKAIAALNSGEIADLYIPAGVYPISAALPPITADGATITGAGKRRSTIKPQGSFDCLRFVSTAPVVTRIGDVAAYDFGIDYGDIEPTAGVALTLDRVARGYFDVDIRNAFQCLLARGGAGNDIASCTMSGSYLWTSLKVGSYIAKFTNYPGTTEVPSEFTIGRINWLGSTAGANHLENGIIIECGDGIFFSTGHAGFAHVNQVLINAQANAALSILNIDFGRVYFDGNNAGSASGTGIYITGSTLPLIIGLKFTGATVRNLAGVGVKCDRSNVQDLDLDTMQFSDIGKEHLDLSGIVGGTLSGTTFRNGNKANGGSSAVKISSSSRITSAGAQVLAGTFAHPKDFDLTAVLDSAFTGNLTEGAVGYSIGLGCDRIAFKGNRKIGSSPTVASATNLPLPRGFDVVTVTGNTAIVGITGYDNTDEEVTLAFTGTATVSDGGGNINLGGAFAPTAGSSLRLRNTSTGWVGTGREVV